MTDRPTCYRCGEPMTFGSLFAGIGGIDLGNSRGPVVSRPIKNDFARLDKFHGKRFEILVDCHVLLACSDEEVLWAMVVLAPGGTDAFTPPLIASPANS